ncbi:MAG: hypothetical protein WC679_02195 [Bacteroidales bacterium]|jgi:hypothetical protein
MSICKVCKECFQLGEYFTGWDCYDDMRYVFPVLFKSRFQPEILFGDDLCHIDCDNPKEIQKDFTS